MKKIKSTITILKKKRKKKEKERKKTIYRNIVTINNVLKKNITWLNSQPVQYLKNLVKIIFKKIKTKNIKKKRIRSQFWGKKTCKTKEKQKIKNKKTYGES
jgi:hypothetical protein